MTDPQSYTMPDPSMARVSTTFAGMPFMTLKRKWTPRVLCILGILIIALPMMAGGTIAFLAERRDPGLIIMALIGLGLAVLMVWLFTRENKRAVYLYEQGIEHVRGANVDAIRWSEVTDVFFFAQRVQAGGLIPMLIGAALEKRNKDKPINENTTQIRVTVVGGGGIKLKLTSNDKGVMAAYDAITGRVNERLLDEATKKIENGETAAFGKIQLSQQGITFGKKAMIPFGEIESAALNGGSFTIKKAGKWLAAGQMMVAAIPNLQVLAALMNRFAGTNIDASGKKLATKTYV